MCGILLHNDSEYSGEETELKDIFNYDYSWAVSDEWRALKLIMEEGVQDL